MKFRCSMRFMQYDLMQYDIFNCKSLSQRRLPRRLFCSSYTTSTSCQAKHVYSRSSFTTIASTATFLAFFPFHFSSSHSISTDSINIQQIQTPSFIRNHATEVAQLCHLFKAHAGEHHRPRMPLLHVARDKHHVPYQNQTPEAN